MAATTAEPLALPASDDLWNALFVNAPDACRVHHCWVDQCQPGSHDAGDTAGEV